MCKLKQSVAQKLIKVLIFLFCRGMSNGLVISLYEGFIFLHRGAHEFNNIRHFSF